jgi:transposase
MERLHHSTVKDLDKLYMQQQVDLAGLPTPRAIGIDEISIRKGHNYRVIVSDLDRQHPIWVGGEGRKEADIDLFFPSAGQAKERPHQTGGHGHLEAIQGLGTEERPECPDHL